MKAFPNGVTIPQGNSRVIRRAICARVERGAANDFELHQVQIIGREGFPWLEFRKLIHELKKLK